MAKKTVITVVDDIDGAELDEYETVRWGIDGKQFEFDASPANAEKFRDHLASYVAASRSAEVKQPQRRPRQAAGSSTRQIREWANANGYTVSDRGRIPIEVTAAYEAAN